MFQHKSVEYQRVASDGKTYGIVREGTKFYIKVSDSAKKDLVKEDFKYIGGFINRKDNEYTSYANALKNFDMKLRSINEACGKKDVVIESWDPEKNEYLVLEATDKMKAEIIINVNPKALPFVVPLPPVFGMFAIFLIFL